jgi:PAS domain S-box-containing protein
MLNTYSSAAAEVAMTGGEPGALEGAEALLQGDVVAQRLAAIVASSEDAIVSKDLNGVVMSWNEGAERLFGYSAREAIGRPITLIIPDDRKDEEAQILGRLRRGQRIDHFETVRQRKDGSLLHISLSVSPIYNSAGEIVGASKIARDITERQRAEEQQNLLLREMNHRIRNLFTLVSGLVTLSARSAGSPEELASAMRERLAALGRAQSLTLPLAPHRAEPDDPTTLHQLIKTIVQPHETLGGSGASERVSIRGPDVALSRKSTTSLALLLHEFATNAVKYGALSTTAGRVEIICSERADGRFELSWIERFGPRIERPPENEGFGTLLARMTVENQFRGEIQREWAPEGLSIRLSVPPEALET